MKSDYGEHFMNGLLEQSKNGPFLMHRIVSILKLLKPTKKDKKILEIGCGIGTISAVIHQNLANIKVVGVDFSKEFIEMAKRQHGLQCDFHIADITYMPEIESGFDAVIAPDVMEHLNDSDFEKAAKQCVSKLKCNGRMAIYSPCRTHFIEIMKRNNFILKKNHTHVGMRSAKEYIEILSRYFDTVEIEYATTHIPILSIIEKAFCFLPIFRRRLCILATGLKEEK